MDRAPPPGTSLGSSLDCVEPAAAFGHAACRGPWERSKGESIFPVFPGGKAIRFLDNSLLEASNSGCGLSPAAREVTQPNKNMSIGICVSTTPEVEIDGYFQNLAMDYHDLHHQFVEHGCDLSPYIFDPESAGMREEMDELEEFEDEEMDEAETAYHKAIVTDDYHPIKMVVESIRKALELARSFDENWFSYGKEGFVADLEELLENLEPHVDSGIRVQLVQA
jgi:hypothetical protein